MNKYIKVRPALFFAGILLGIILLFYSFSQPFSIRIQILRTKELRRAAGAGRN
jgi:hypothetical protein